MGIFIPLRWSDVRALLRLQGTHLQNGHCKFYLGTFDNVDDLIEQMEDHQWFFSAITHPRFQKHIGQRTTRFDYGSKDCYYLATFSGGEKND